MISNNCWWLLPAIALGAQTPLDNEPYKIAEKLSGDLVSDSAVADAWNSLFAKDPEMFEVLASGFPPKGQPLEIEEREDLDTVVHAQFPHYSVRVKDPSSLGVDNVKQRSGYFDLLDEDKHYFFWMFESRNDPKNDPVVLWINGGPGCSSFVGQFFELGPSKVLKDLSLETNPYSWNNNATVIFLDQPVNVGFSYSKNKVKNSAMGAKDVYAFLSIFFTEFSEYKDLPFHISGESYAGHYLPAIGYEILQHPDRNFNFTSVLIGNGITDLHSQADAQVSMACGMGGFKPVLNQTTCEKLYDDLPACLKLAQVCDEDRAQLPCVIANYVCSAFKQPYYETGRSAYDIRDKCFDHCDPEQAYVDQYLDQDHVKKAIGAEPIGYTGCSDSVYLDYINAGDRGLSMKKEVTALLEANIPVLIYAGDKDYNCNWLGNQAWTDNLSWSGEVPFASARLHPWYFDGQVVGESKNHGPFTFLRIYEAGHMVPYYKPQESLSMFNHWLAGNRNFTA